MNTEKIAVITTCDQDFERFKSSQPKEIQKMLCKISYLQDIKHKEYKLMVLLKESENVTDFVIKKVRKISLDVEDLSKSVAYL